MARLLLCAWCGEVLGGEYPAPPSQTSHGICYYCAEGLHHDTQPNHNDPVWGEWITLGNAG